MVSVRGKEKEGYGAWEILTTPVYLEAEGGGGICCF